MEGTRRQGRLLITRALWAAAWSVRMGESTSKFEVSAGRVAKVATDAAAPGSS